MRMSWRAEVKHLLPATTSHMGMRCSQLGGKTYPRKPNKGHQRLYKLNQVLYICTIQIAENLSL